MSLRVSGKNMNIGEALRLHAHEKVQAVVGKFFDGDIHGHITIAPEGSGFRADCVLRLGSGVDIQADGRAQEPYASFDQAVERLERRLRRYKDRLKSHGKHTTSMADDSVSNYVLEALSDTEEAPSEGEFSPTIIAETTSRLKSLTIAAAVIELDLTGVTAMAFRHAGNGRINVVYRRNDGNIGWIDPGGATPHDVKG